MTLMTFTTNKRSTAKTYDCVQECEMLKEFKRLLHKKCFVKNVELKWLREDTEVVQINVKKKLNKQELNFLVFLCHQIVHNSKLTYSK
ncbi:hypothetical protein BpHYR1_036535 [Brachionus plicatilis]|uniref:Uncharacterized protein n=1 Tax=Brachionus plicatilis TaxID=10195 RepID=A0A3M7QLP2_BRAPC|nr:hypothetical protein BpHYR1_036535 [Brachionus plicatilis]